MNKNMIEGNDEKMKESKEELKVLSKTPSGIPGFDEISKGGIPYGRTTLVSGTSGSGKTVFATQFLYNGIVKHGMNGVFVTFEERPIDIMRNMKSFSWDIKQLVDEKKWAFVDASPDESDKVEVGQYDFSGFLARIQYAVKSVDAKRVAIDSVSALFPRYEDASIIRRELYRTCSKLKGRNITAVMTAERPVEDGSIARFGVEEFVSDNVILLHNRLTHRGDRERTVEILKFRGSAHEVNEAPLIVGNVGMEIFPRPKPELRGKGFFEKLSTGVSGLDDMLHGGVYKNSTTLLTGASGTGKTVSVLHFIIDGAKNGEKCMLIEFEESPEQLYRNAESFGWNLKEHVDNGIVQLICHYPEDLKAEQYMKVIKDLISESSAQRVGFDSLSALERIYEPEKFREFVIGLNAFLKMQGCTSIMTNTTNELLGMSQITSTHLSTATDNIIVLKYVELGGQMKRLVSVLKARGSDHKKELAEFKIAEKGMEIQGYFTGFEGLLSGSARKINISFDEKESEQELLQEIKHMDAEN
jgi:circadian clock protein KaiC